MAFKPGESGNPRGRPKGIQDRRTRFRDLVEPNSEELINTAVSLALGGNEAMLKLLLERLLPAKPKEEPVEISLPKKNLTKQMHAILNTLNNGEITISEGTKLMQLTLSESKIIEFEELNDRVEQLEKAISESG